MRMNINRHNYEVFFLDHIEGRLSHEQEKELKEFLATNPDLASELDDFEPVYLDEKEKISFPGKSGIKKNEGELTPATQLIALMEGDLPMAEAADLNKQLQTDKYLAAQWALLQKTRLVPDLSIRMPGKNSLKRGGKVIHIWRYAVAAAAVLVIGLTVVLKNVPDKKPNDIVAQQNTPVVPSTTSSENDSISKSVDRKNDDALAESAKPAFPSAPKKTDRDEKRREQNTHEPIAPVQPLADNQITSISSEEPLKAEHVAIKENDKPALARESTFSYKDVFDEAEWKELNNMTREEDGSLVQQLAKTGINRLGELTGVKVQVPGKENQQNAFAFSIGKFEVRHVSGK